MYENEWFPKVNAMGVSWGDFWHMNPRIVRLLSEGHKEKIKEMDYLNWMSSWYMLSAVTVGVERNLAGKKAMAKHIEKPFMSDMEFGEKEISPEEKIEMENQKLAMTLRIMQVNYEIGQRRRALEERRR